LGGADEEIDACYTPAALATEEDLRKKKEIFERRERTVGFPLGEGGLANECRLTGHTATSGALMRS
jgi:hypothetical protein